MTYDPRIYRDVFYRDNNLRDIYVQDTTVHDWQMLLDFLRASSYPLELGNGDEPLPIPENVEELFPLVITLRIDRERLGIFCLVSDIEEIELSLDPEYIQNDEQVTYLLEFIYAIGRRLHKPVVIMPEDGYGDVLY